MSRALGIAMGIMAAVCLAGCGGGNDADDADDAMKEAADKAPAATLPADE